MVHLQAVWGFPGGSDSRLHLHCRRPGFDPWVGKIPWRRKWQLTPVFFPGESHGQRSLVGYSPWGHKESDTTEQLTLTSQVVCPLCVPFSSPKLARFSDCNKEGSTCLSHISALWEKLAYFLRSKHCCE